MSADVVWCEIIPDSICYRPLNVPKISASTKFKSDRRLLSDLAKRARIIMRLADGASYADLIRLGESSRTIAKWKQRFLE